MKNRVKMTILGTWLLLPFQTESSELNGKAKELFGTGSAANRESASLENCHSKRVDGGKNYLATNHCWRVCEALLPQGKRWPDIVQEYGQGQGDIASLWNPAVKSFIQLRIEQTDQSVKSQDTAEEFEHLLGLLHQCHALITVSGHSDYSNDKLLPGAGPQTQVRASLVNPQLKCRTTGYDTQDYSKCVSLIKLYDTFTFAKKAKETVDLVRYDDHVADKNDELVKKRLRGDTVGAKDGIEVQKESFKKQRDITTENMTISAAQTAALVAIIGSMPTLKSLLQEDCLPQMEGKEREFQKLYEMGKVIAATAPSAPSSPMAWPSKPKEFLEADPLCANLMKMNINLILNTDARDMGIALGTQSGIEALANLAKGALLKNRIKGLDGAIKKIDKFEPQPLTEEEMEEAYFRECVLMPDLPKCKIGKRRSVDGIKNSYSFGNETQSTTIGEPTSPNEASDSDSTSNVKRDNLPQGIGVPLPDVGSLGNDDFSGFIPPGASYAGKGLGNPGGGSGGGAGSASPPGNSVGQGGGSRPSPSPLPPPKVKYDGSGGGWKGYNSGGGGNNRRTSQSSNKNPFAKLFGKKTNKKGGSELVEFRNPASKKNTSQNIFKRLSNRYQDANKRKKLLEYSVEQEN